MSTKIDGRGLACPGPVIAIKKALESMNNGVVTILLDNNIAKENVVKFSTAHGCGVSITEQGGDFLLTISKGDTQPKQVLVHDPVAMDNTVYVFTQNTLGQGNPELGAVLIKGFLYALLETTPKPKTLVFMNGGVLLTIEGSPVIDHLSKLAESGVEIISCGTCLDYFSVKDKLAIGAISNMYTIVEIMTVSAKVITL